MFLLPITYLGILHNYDGGYIQNIEAGSKLMFVVDFNNLLLRGLAMIWFAATMFVLAYCVKNEIGKRKICRNNFDDGISLAQTEFKRIKAELGIKGSVELLHNDTCECKSPFVVGIRHRKVVLPYQEYSKEELKVILYHELNHVKKWDTIFRYLTITAIVLNSINPLVYVLWGEMLLWSEADCDARAIECLEKEGISKKKYYDTIWALMDGSSDSSKIYYYPMLMSAGKSLYRRMEIMEKYRVSMMKTAKKVTFALTMVFAMFSSVVAHAAGVGIAEANDAGLQKNQEILLDASFVNSEDWSDEMLVETDDSVNIVYINDGIMTLGSGTIDWNVPVGTRYVTNSIYMTQGTEVQIVCAAEPTDCLYWFGLMYASSTCNVVEGTGAGSHVFTVPSNGYYRIMVENRGSSTLSVTGGYRY